MGPKPEFGRKATLPTRSKISSRSALEGQVGSAALGPLSTCGIYFTLSSDLIHWSDMQLVVATNAYECASNSPSALEQVDVRFPAIIDHGDMTINFEQAGRTAYLYYVRFNRSFNDPLYWLDRDVVRVPITFTRID